MFENNMVDKYGAAGKVVVGTTKYLSNANMTESNHIRNIVGSRPDIIQGLFKHFAFQSGMITELLHAMKNTYDPDADKFLKNNFGRYVDQKMTKWNKNFKILNNFEFAWQAPAPEGWLYRVVTPPTFDQDDMVGANNMDFIFTVNVQLGDKDDIWLLADGVTQIMLTQQPVLNADGTMRVRARVHAAPGMHGRGIPRRLLERGVELGMCYNLKPEASSTGSKSLVRFGEWMRGFMSCLRWEYNITGHAAHMKNDSTREVLVYYAPDGSIEPYWTETWRYNMMKNAYTQMDNHLFWGLPATDQDGRFIRDEQGMRYISGLGLYHQANRRLKREYDELNDFSLIDNMMETMYYDSLENDADNVFMVFGALKFRQSFDRLIRNEFKFAPQVLYWDGTGNFQFGQGGGGKDAMGLKSNFQYYETPAGKFIVSQFNYFDRKSMPSLYTKNGAREQSYRGIIVNIGNLRGGTNAMTMVTLSGRQNVLGRVAGMSRPGPGGVLTTTRDVEGEHMLTMQGLALHNPNCIAELRKARGRD